MDQELHSDCASPNTQEGESTIRKRSIIWAYFTKVSKNEAKCNKCLKILKTPTSSTSSLRMHIQLLHPVENAMLVSDTKQKKLNKDAEQSEKRGNLNDTATQNIRSCFENHQKLSSQHPAAKKVTEKIGLMIAKDFQPYSIVCDTGFRELISALEPRYQIPDRSTFSRSVIPSLYSKCKNAVRKVLQNDIESGVHSLTYTTDMWTSRATDCYISFTVHYLRNDFTPVNLVLANSVFPQSHTGQNILHKLEAIEQEWNLPTMTTNTGNTGRPLPVYTVSDNASNIKAAINNSRWTAVKCFAHTLQLAISDCKKSTPGVNNVCSKGRAIVGHFHRSPKAYNKLEKLQETFQTEKHRLIQDVDTRWNSEYAMLQRLVEQREPVTAYLSSSDDTTDSIINLSSSEWKLAAGYIQVLKPLADATKELCGENYPTLSMVIPVLYCIHSALDNLIRNKEAGTGIMFARNLSEALQDRFPSMWKYEDVYLISMVVDPRFKTVILSHVDKNRALTTLQDVCAAYQIPTIDERNTNMGQPEQGDGNVASSGGSRVQVADSLWNAFDTLINTSQSNEGEYNDHVLAELRQFLQEKVIPRKNGPGPLKWWKENRSRFPNLAKIALHYLGIPATQVASERLFSTSGNIVTPRRESILPEHVHQLCFINGNYFHM